MSVPTPRLSVEELETLIYQIDIMLMNEEN
jgi:hypothetical protein